MRVTTPQEPFPPSVGPTSPQPHRNHYTYSLLFLSILFILGFGWPHHTRSIPSPRPHSPFVFFPLLPPFIYCSYCLLSIWAHPTQHLSPSAWFIIQGFHKLLYQKILGIQSRIIKSMSYCFFLCIIFFGTYGINNLIILVYIITIKLIVVFGFYL